MDGTPKVQKKKKEISSPNKIKAENNCEVKTKERKRSTKENEEKVTKTPKASTKPIKAQVINQFYPFLCMLEPKDKLTKI